MTHLRRRSALGVASAALILATSSVGHARATPDHQVRVRCGDAQYALSGPPPYYRTILGIVGLPQATRHSTLTKYVIAGDTRFQRRFPYVVYVDMFVKAGATPITLTVPADWAPRELLTTNVQESSRSSKAFTSVRVDACPGFMGVHSRLSYQLTLFIPRSGCYPLDVEAGTRRTRISLNLSLKLTRSCRPRT
jgi:hypothetical protein